MKAIILSLVFILNFAHAEEVTHEVFPVADTYVTSEAENRNYGGESLLDLKTYYAGTRLLIKFDKNQIKNLLTNKDLVSARLELPIQNHYVKIEGQIGLFKMNVDWTENGATWKCPIDTDTSNWNQDCSNPWLMWSHDPNNTIPYPYDLSPFATGTINADQAVPVGFNIEGYINDLVLGNIANNYGLAVYKISTNINDPLAFYSRESDVGPKIVLTVKDKAPVSTGVSAKLSSSVSSGSVPLAVQFDASLSKPKTGSSIDKIELNLGNGYVTLDKLNPIYNHTFSTEGEYQAILKVTDVLGDVGYAVINISALGDENNNLDSNYGYWINFPSNLNVKYSNGQQAQISGDICKIWKTQSKTGNCQWVDKQRIQIRAFFPDMTKEVSSLFNVTTDNQRRNFTYQSPALNKNNLNVLTILVGEIDPSSIQFGALKSKLEMRIMVLDQKIIDYENEGVSEDVLKVLREVRTTLISLADKIDHRNAKVPSTLAQYNLPLQVDNRVSAGRYYSTMVGGFRYELSSDIGNLYQGDYANIKSRVTNINYTSDNTYDLEGYNLKYTYKNALKTTQFRPSFAKGEVHEYIFQDSTKSNLTDFYGFGVEIEEKFKWWSRSLGSSEFSMPVMEDTEAPYWVNPQTEILYTTHLPIFSEKAVDNFGRLNRGSFKAILSGQSNADITSLFSFESTSGGTDYVIRADLRAQFATEGQYNLTYTIADFEGHKATPEPYVRKYHIDRTPPFIMLPYLNPISTNQTEFSIPVSIADRSNFRLRIYVNAVEQINENITNDNQYSGEHTVSLNEGINLVKVEVTDIVGNTSSINYPSILLDTIAPVVAISNLSEGQVIRTSDYSLSITSSELLKEAFVNGEKIELEEGFTHFSKMISHASVGEQVLEVTLVDMVGNSNTISYNYRVQLNILRIELVALSPTEEGKIQVAGASGAADEGISLEIDGGFFNTETIYPNSDGSFVVNLDPFNAVELRAYDYINDIEERYTLNFNADTTLSGVVKDPQDNPLPGVTVTIVSSGQASVTNLQGVFHIPDPVLGDQKLLIDGATIPESYTQGAKEFSSVALNISIGRLQQNILQRTIYISPKLLDGTETIIEPNTSVVVQSAHAPGVALEIPANAVNFPEGIESRSINMMEIDAQKTSVELPEGVSPATVVALEPSGLKFTEPVKLVLPNNNDFPEGIELVIMSKNSTTGLWEVDGSATVVNNQIETKPGQGITHFSEVFASPFGLEMNAVGPKDRPGIENSIGEMTTTVNLPSYSRLGNNIEPQLIYKSSWANPTAIVSNTFNLPHKYFEFSGSLSEGNWAGSAKVTSLVQTWLTPDSIDTQFFVNDIASERMTFRAESAPDKAVVSYAVDLSSMKSGVYPASAEYEVKYRNFTLRTTKVKVKSFFKSTTHVDTVVDRDIIESVFPPDLRTLVFHQNKKHSEFGAGWKFATNQQIINPGEDRIMVENANGSVSSYTVKNSVETIYTDSEELDSAYMDGSNIYVKDTLNKVKKINGSNSSLVRSLPNYTGYVGFNWNTLWRNETLYAFRLCTYGHAGFDVPRKVNNMFMMGGRLVYSDSLGAILDVNDDSVVSGQFKTLETLDSVESFDYQSHCQLHLNASCGGILSQLYYINIKPHANGGAVPGDCNNPAYFYTNGTSAPRTSRQESYGTVPSRGYADASATGAKFNNPMAIIAGNEANTIIVADSGNNLVRKVNLGTNTITNIAGNQQTYDNGNDGLATQASIYHPRGIALDINGNLYISSENGYIRKVSPEGVITALAGKPLGEGGVLTEIGNMKSFNFKTPSNMVMDNDNGYLYVADTGNHRIVQIDLIEGIAKSVAGNGICSLGPVKEGSPALETSICNPVHIGLDSNNNLLYLDKTNKRVRKVVFNNNSNGIQRFASSVIDNSEIIKNPDGSYIREYRNGSKAFFNQLGLHTRSESLDGKTYQYEYDSDKHLTSIIDPSGGVASLEYSGDKMTRFTDPAGRQTQFYYNGSQLIEISFPDGTSKSFSYNGNNLLTQEINQRGYATQYGYNVWSRISFVKGPDNSLIQLEDYQSKTFADSYDGSTRKLVNYSGNESAGLSDVVKDANSAETKFIRDTNGYTTTIIDSAGRETSIDRDLEGRPVKITRPDETFTSFLYNENTGDLLEKFESSTETKEVYTYNERGQLLSHKDHANRLFTKTYDVSTGRLISETDPNNLSTTRTYGTYGLVSTITNALSQTQSYQYDNNGNLSQATFPMGETVSYVRDNAGNLLSKTNAKGQVTEYTYDYFNRLLSVKSPTSYLTSYSYLETGELSQIVNPKGHLTKFDYDTVGRLIKKTSPLGQISQLAYDNNGNVIQEIDPKGQVKSFEYNTLNQLVRKVVPDNIYVYSYTDSGKIKSIADNDSYFDYNYTQIHGDDYLSGITQEVLDIPEQAVSYTLDILGRRTRLQSPVGTIDYSYGNVGQILSVTNHKNEVFGFSYDNAYRLTGVSHNGVISTGLSFDANSFLASMVSRKTSNQAVLNSFSYQRDAVHNRTSMTTTNGVHDYQYDNENQLISSSHPEADQFSALELFTYDSLGNRLTDQGGDFSYDEKSYRLEEDYKYLYAYDANGNLVTRQEKGMTGKLINLSYSSENQVVGINIIEDGNTVRSVEYSYDALGRRSQKKIVENSTEKIRKYIYDGNEILAELNGNNSVLVRYTHSGLRTDDTLAMDVTSAGVSEGIAPTSGTYHFLKDGLGSIIDITDSAGTLIQHYVYGSFGKILKITNGGVDSTQNPLIKNSFTFTNREYDVESGFYHYRARMYDSHSGRFLQEDPHPGYLSQASTFNSAYIYSLNNPINRVDPSGRMSFWKALGISLTAAWAGGVAGGAAGAAVGGPWGVVVGVVVGAVVGAVTAVAVNGIMNSVEGKTFFYEWEQAAIIGAIAGGIAGGRAAYNEIYSTGRVPASVENPNADVDGVNNDFLDMDECIRAGKPGCLDESMLTPDPTQGKENQLDKAYEIRERNLDRLLWGK